MHRTRKRRPPGPHSHLATMISLSLALILFLSQDPVHKWADLQRALLAEGQSVWCCKGCIGIINEDKDATYKDIRVKVEAAAAARLEPLPEVTGLGDSQVARATDPSSIASTDAGGTDAGGTDAGGTSRTANDSLEARMAGAASAAGATEVSAGTTMAAGAAGAAAAADQEQSRSHNLSVISNELRLEQVETGISEIQEIQEIQRRAYLSLANTQEALANTQRAAVVCNCAIL